MSNCIIEKALPNGMVLIALGSRRDKDFNNMPKKAYPILLTQKQEFDAADRAAIEAYKAELLAEMPTQTAIVEPSCPPVGNSKRKNSAHLTNPM